MDELAEIRQLENDIEILADLEAKLGRYARREPHGEHRQMVENRICDIGRQADLAEARLNELVAKRQLIAAQNKRRELLKKISTPPARVTFFEIEEVA